MMNYLNQQYLASFERVGQYFADHPLVTPILRVTALTTELAGVVTNMRVDNTSQASGLTLFRGGTDARRQAFDTLLVEMRAINKIARGLDPVAFPTMREQFRMPQSRSFTNIAAYARTFVTNATGKEAVFTDRGLAVGFLVAFTTLVDAAEEAVQSRNTGLLNRSGATAGITAKRRRGAAITRELDAIMATVLRNDPVLLATWRTAKRVARRAPAEETPTDPGSGSGTTPPPTGS